MSFAGSYILIRLLYIAELHENIVKCTLHLCLTKYTYHWREYILHYTRASVSTRFIGENIQYSEYHQLADNCLNSGNCSLECSEY